MNVYKITFSKIELVKYINVVLTQEISDKFVPMEKICVDIIGNRYG